MPSCRGLSRLIIKAYITTYYAVNLDKADNEVAILCTILSIITVSFRRIAITIRIVESKPLRARINDVLDFARTCIEVINMVITVIPSIWQWCRVVPGCCLSSRANKNVIHLISARICNSYVMTIIILKLYSFSWICVICIAYVLNEIVMYVYSLRPWIFMSSEPLHNYFSLTSCNLTRYIITFRSPLIIVSVCCTCVGSSLRRLINK